MDILASYIGKKILDYPKAWIPFEDEEFSMGLARYLFCRRPEMREDDRRLNLNTSTDMAAYYVLQKSKAENFAWKCPQLFLSYL